MNFYYSFFSVNSRTLNNLRAKLLFDAYGSTKDVYGVHFCEIPPKFTDIMEQFLKHTPSCKETFQCSNGRCLYEAFNLKPSVYVNAIIPTIDLNLAVERSFDVETYCFNCQSRSRVKRCFGDHVFIEVNNIYGIRN